jgi:hypothetical protein
VPVTTLKQIVFSSSAPVPDMVKIDAQGFDLKVLAGASDLFGKTDIFLVEALVRTAGAHVRILYRQSWASWPTPDTI